ncbi:MAG: heavy metal-binding domain-containing protein [Bryobacteraceae bacterium]
MALRAVALIALAVAAAAQSTAPAPEPAPPPIAFSCPMDPEIRSLQPGKCSRCGMRLEAGIADRVGYPIDLRVTPAAAPAGQPIEIRLSPRHPKTGAPVTNYEIVHEKLFHLFIVSSDLQHFAHVHPEPQGATFRLIDTLPRAGVYRLLADYYPAGGTPQLTPLTIATAGFTGPLVATPLEADLAPKRGTNLEVELVTEPPEPIAGKKTLLFFRLKPGEGLEPLLGAWGHLLAASNDLIDMIHGHPSIADGGPQVQFDVFFPREAVYRVWVQFQRQGQVNTVQFTIPVSRLK